MIRKELTIVIKDGSISEVYSDTTDTVDINVINLDNEASSESKRFYDWLLQTTKTKQRKIY